MKPVWAWAWAQAQVIISCAVTGSADSAGKNTAAMCAELQTSLHGRSILGPRDTSAYIQDLGILHRMRRACFAVGTRVTTRLRLAHLFDHLISAQENRWRYHKGERLGGLEVHGHLKFCRQLNG